MASGLFGGDFAWDGIVWERDDRQPFFHSEHYWDSLVDKIKQIEKKHPVFKKFNRHSTVFFFFLILTWTS